MVAMGEPRGPGARAAKILSPTFFPGWQARGVFHPFVVFDRLSGEYRMCYTGAGTVQMNDSVSDTWVTGVVTSKDGLTWSTPKDYEPVLLARRFLEGDVVDREEQSGVFDSLFAFGACVLKDRRNYRMWYTGWNGDTSNHREDPRLGRVERVHFRIGHATSRDGLSWEKRPGTGGAGSVIGLGAPGEPDSQGASHPHVMKEPGLGRGRRGGDLYRMWYEGDDGKIRRICWATSRDGTAWEKRGAVLEPGPPGAPDELGVGHPVVIKRKGRYELWYQGRGRSDPSFRILRATSPDGEAWTRAGEVALHPDPPLRGDESIHVRSIIVSSDGACRVFFAKETTTTRRLPYGAVPSKSFHIYTETVNP